MLQKLTAMLVNVSACIRKGGGEGGSCLFVSLAVTGKVCRICCDILTF